MNRWHVLVKNGDGSTAWTMTLAEYPEKSKGLMLEPGQSLAFAFKDDTDEWVTIPIERLPLSVEWSET